MKIGYDGKRAVDNLTGLGNYSRLVIEQVGKKLRPHYHNTGYDTEETPVTAGKDFGMHIADPKAVRKHNADLMRDNNLLVYIPKMNSNSRLEPIRRLPNVEFRFPPAQGFQGELWRTFGVTNNIAADSCQIFHGLTNELPLNIRTSGVKSIVTIHDLIHRRLPGYFSLTERMIRDFKYRRACINADRIIAISECTKKDIIEFYKIPEEKIEVIYQGCDDIFRATYTLSEQRETAQRLNLPSLYIVQVGNVEKRKNLEVTVRALSALPDELHLVIIGKDRGGYLAKIKQLAKELGVYGRISHYDSVDFHDLPIILGGAEASIYPSRYEGFGIPVIESIECGTPVIAANGSSLEEAGGPDAIYIDPDNPRTFAYAISVLMENPDFYETSVRIAQKFVKRFDNDRMTDSIIDLYQRTLSDK